MNRLMRFVPPQPWQPSHSRVHQLESSQTPQSGPSPTFGKCQPCLKQSTNAFHSDLTTTTTSPTISSWSHPIHPLWQPQCSLNVALSGLLLGLFRHAQLSARGRAHTAFTNHIVMLHCTLYYDTRNVNSVSYDRASRNSFNPWIIQGPSQGLGRDIQCMI